ncbi:CHAT domain-containing protein [bacterium]|nr:CHAT domain-containing protein [candidate division CSSED10-310 bacterium]
MVSWFKWDNPVTARLWATEEIPPEKEIIEYLQSELGSTDKEGGHTVEEIARRMREEPVDQLLRDHRIFLRDYLDFFKCLKGNSAWVPTFPEASVKTLLAELSRTLSPGAMGYLLMMTGEAYTRVSLSRNADFAERGIEYLEAAIPGIQADTKRYGMLLERLSVCYALKTTGDKTALMNHSRKLILSALRIFRDLRMTRETLNTLCNLGTQYFNRFDNRQNNLMKALAIFQVCERSADPDRYPDILAKCYKNISRILFSRQSEDEESDKRKAIEYMDKSSALYEAAGNAYESACQRCNMALVLIDTPYGNIEDTLLRAEQLAMDARIIFHRLECPDAVFRVDILLGDLYFRKVSGDRGMNCRQALLHYRNALRDVGIAETEKASILTRIGVIYRNDLLGNRRENLCKAIATCEEACRIIEPINDPEQFCYIEINTGHAYRDLYHETGVTEYVRKARSHYDRAVSASSGSPGQDAWVSAWNGLGLSWLEETVSDTCGAFSQARSCFEQCLQYRSSDNRPLDYAMTCLNLGRLYLKVHRYAEAIEYFENGLVDEVRNVKPRLYRDLAHELGNARLHGGESEQAGRAFDLACEADRCVKKQAHLLETMMADMPLRSSLYFDGSWCFALLGDNAKALRWVEFGKTAVLHRFCGQEQRVFETMDVCDRTRLTALNGELQRIELERVMTPTHEQNDDRLMEIMRQINAIMSQSQGLATDAAEADPIEDLKTVLDDSTVLIELSFSSHGAVIFLIRKDGSRLCIEAVLEEAFTADRLSVLMHEWHVRYRAFRDCFHETDVQEQWSAFVRKTVDIFSKDLLYHAKRLIRTWEPLRVVIIPSRHSQALPLHMAIHEHDRNTGTTANHDSTGNRCLHPMKSPLITCSLSLGIWLKNRQTIRRPGNGSLTAVSNPTGDLVHAQNEVNEIARYFKEKTIFSSCGGSDQKEMMLGAMRDSEYLHFACHGVFLDDNPYSSYLATGTVHPDTAPGTAHPDTAPGTAHPDTAEIPVLRRRPMDSSGDHLAQSGLSFRDIVQLGGLNGCSLVVLAACESGLTSSMNADEAIAIQSAFLVNHARYVISSLWKVEDRASREFMTLFYRLHRLNQLDIPHACMAARTDMMNRYGKDNVFLWAGFEIYE